MGGGGNMMDAAVGMAATGIGLGIMATAATIPMNAMRKGFGQKKTAKRKKRRKGGKRSRR